MYRPSFSSSSAAAVFLGCCRPLSSFSSTSVSRGPPPPPSLFPPPPPPPLRRETVKASSTFSAKYNTTLAHTERRLQNALVSSSTSSASSLNTEIIAALDPLQYYFRTTIHAVFHLLFPILRRRGEVYVDSAFDRLSIAQRWAHQVGPVVGDLLSFVDACEGLFFRVEYQAPLPISSGSGAVDPARKGSSARGGPQQEGDADAHFSTHSLSPLPPPAAAVSRFAMYTGRMRSPYVLYGKLIRRLVGSPLHQHQLLLHSATDSSSTGGGGGLPMSFLAGVLSWPSFFEGPYGSLVSFLHSCGRWTCVMGQERQLVPLWPTYRHPAGAEGDGSVCRTLYATLRQASSGSLASTSATPTRVIKVVYGSYTTQEDLRWLKAFECVRRKAPSDSTKVDVAVLLCAYEAGGEAAVTECDWEVESLNRDEGKSGCFDVTETQHLFTFLQSRFPYHCSTMVPSPATKETHLVEAEVATPSASLRLFHTATTAAAAPARQSPCAVAALLLSSCLTPHLHYSKPQRLSALIQEIDWEDGMGWGTPTESFHANSSSLLPSSPPPPPPVWYYHPTLRQIMSAIHLHSHHLCVSTPASDTRSTVVTVAAGSGNRESELPQPPHPPHRHHLTPISLLGLMIGGCESPHGLYDSHGEGADDTSSCQQRDSLHSSLALWEMSPCPPAGGLQAAPEDVEILLRPVYSQLPVLAALYMLTVSHPTRWG